MGESDTFIRFWFNCQFLIMTHYPISSGNFGSTKKGFWYYFFTDNVCTPLFFLLKCLLRLGNLKDGHLSLLYFALMSLPYEPFWCGWLVWKLAWCDFVAHVDSLVALKFHTRWTFIWKSALLVRIKTLFRWLASTRALKCGEKQTIRDTNENLCHFCILQTRAVNCYKIEWTSRTGSKPCSSQQCDSIDFQRMLFSWLWIARALTSISPISPDHLLVFCAIYYNVGFTVQQAKSFKKNCNRKKS